MATLSTQNTNNTSALNLVFIDSGVEDYQYLLQGVIPNTQAYIINSEGDGIEQISQILQQYQDIDAVHIISHGSPGCLYLGNSQLNLDNLNSYASQLQQWNIKNLLLYGCYVAVGDAGTEFIEKLHNLTGAEIAASQSLTGSAIKGGNWHLEYQTAEAKYSLVLLDATVTHYAGVLAVSMVKDINPGIGTALPFVVITTLKNVNGTLFFRANDGVHGWELWKSDGTPNGTVLVKDINPGIADFWTSTGFYVMGNVNNTLLFENFDKDQLWKSDGTANGTVLVKDFNPGPDDNITRLHLSFAENSNGTLYFPAHDNIHGWGLWKSNGTANGTILVKDFNPNSNDNESIYDLKNVNGTLFCKIDSNQGQELWKTDGTTNGTILIKDFNSINDNLGKSLTNINGIVFFTAHDPIHGSELWKSDGTPSGTVLVKDINPGSAYSYARNFTNVNGTLFFQASDPIHGFALWKSDGTPSGTVLVKDIGISNGNGINIPANFNFSVINVNGTAFFQAYDPIRGFELWKSDGTPSGTVLVKDINPGSAGSYPNDLININSTLYFSANDSTHGWELWKSDGTTNGTVLVADINPGLSDSYPGNLEKVNGNLYFSANDGIHGRELWKLETGTDNRATSGPDKLIGTVGADTIDGLAGNDTISGLGGNDRLLGSAGDDSIDGGAGDDAMIGGTGNDIYIVNSAKDRVTEALNAGTDRIFSTATYTLPANVEHLTLQGTRAINGNGNTLNNRITGNTAANKINGGGGNDTLIGGGGNDTFLVNPGNDRLTGGKGADKFTYNTNAKFDKTAVGLDKITDFVIAQADKIVLDKNTFPKISSMAGSGFSQKSEFAKVTSNTAAATSAADIVYNSATGGLFYNENGTAAGFGTGGQFLTLTNKPALTASQFIIQA